MSAGTPNRIECAVSSRYNFSVPTKDGALLYNANTGAILHFTGKDALELAAALSSGVVEVGGGEFPESSLSIGRWWLPCS